MPPYQAQRTDIAYPVILLTARSGDEAKISGYAVGADSYISKPFSFDVLLVRIKQLIEQQEGRKKEFRKTLRVNPSRITITSIDEQLLQKALKLIEEHIDNSEYNVEQLSTDMGMSRMNLYRKLQAITGQTPTEFIRTIRLKRAAQLLQDGKLNVSEVADRWDSVLPAILPSALRSSSAYCLRSIPRQMSLVKQMKNKASKNVSAFRFKRKCVLFETQVRFDQNARTFELKRTCVFSEYMVVYFTLFIIFIFRL